MYNFFKKNIKQVTLAVLLLSSLPSVYAASLSIVAPDQALSTREPFVVSLVVDAQQDTLSGIAGSFSFQSDLFNVDSIRTEGSIVSLWATQPSVSDERYLDGRTHINFEGIFPGGYDGIRSPYYSGKKPGVVFSVILIPKNKGIGTLLVDDIKLNAFTEDAKALQADAISKTVIIPALIRESPKLVSQDLRYNMSKTLTSSITRDVLVNNNAWYLMINELEQKSSIKKIYVSESEDATAPEVTSSLWREIVIPYILLDQHRSHYVHIKILYSDSSYTIQSLPPVENSSNIWHVSRILLGISVVLLLLYMHAKNIFTTFTKKYNQEK